jgi:hypothetical protein
MGTPGPRWPIRDRFWKKVLAGGPDDCWPWLACADKTGYGRFQYGGARGKTDMAHRVALLLTIGPPPPGKPFALHHCPNGDRKDCVNPRHLRWGTPSENMQDALAAGTLRVYGRLAGQATCKRGHSDWRVRADGAGRTCRSCMRLTNAAHLARKRASACFVAEQADTPGMGRDAAPEGVIR